MAEEREKPARGAPQADVDPAKAPPCPKCEGTGLNSDRSRFCTACLGSAKQTRRQYGWQ